MLLYMYHQNRKGCGRDPFFVCTKKRALRIVSPTPNLVATSPSSVKPQAEYSVLVTSLSDEVLTLAQHYRDRGDAETHCQCAEVDREAFRQG
jgi:hypothetical protein